MFWKKNYAEWSALPLRLALGIVFLMHGAQKLFGAFSGPGIEGTQGFMASLGVVLPGFMGIVVAAVEFFGGLLVLLVLFTRYASLLIAVDMFFAFLLVHMKNGFFLPMGYEFVFTLFLIAIALVLTGAGKWSLEKALFRKEF